MQLTLGTNIRLLRRSSGQTQEALAAVLGVTPQAVSRWEAGGAGRGAGGPHPRNPRITLEEKG